MLSEEDVISAMKEVDMCMTGACVHVLPDCARDASVAGCLCSRHSKSLLCAALCVFSDPHGCPQKLCPYDSSQVLTWKTFCLRHPGTQTTTSNTLSWLITCWLEVRRLTYFCVCTGRDRHANKYISTNKCIIIAVHFCLSPSTDTLFLLSSLSLLHT